MSEGRILVVDNDQQIRRVVRINLVWNGFEVDDAKSGDEALGYIRSGNYDLVLLDIKMPGMTGFETCRAIRALSDVPIIMLSVRSAENDKVQALDAGADDYITKPFSTPDLLARVRAALRNSAKRSPSPELARARLHLGDVAIDFEARQIRGPHGQAHLSPKEFAVLSYLVSHPNKPVSYRELLHSVWGPQYADEIQYVRVFVNRLRKKIEQNPTTPKILVSESCFGYRLLIPE